LKIALDAKNDIMKLFFTSLLLAAVVGAGCSNRYMLDSRTVQRYNLTPELLENVQFYSTKDILLTRYAKDSVSTYADNGRINMDTGKEVDQVMIEAGTRGKLVKHLGKNKVAISFEPDDSKYLVFGVASDGFVYYLQAKSWKNNRGLINYGGQTYLTHAGAQSATVEFKLKKKFNEERELRKAKGNRVK